MRNKTQEPSWNTHNRGLTSSRASQYASVWLFLCCYSNFTVIQTVSNDIVCHVHKMEELDFKILYSRYVIIQACVVLFYWRGQSKRGRGGTVEGFVYKSKMCFHPHLFSNMGIMMNDTTQQGHDGNRQPTLQASQRGLTAGYHTHCLFAMCLALWFLFLISTKTKQAWNKLHFLQQTYNQFLH